MDLDIIKDRVLRKHIAKYVIRHIAKLGREVAINAFAIYYALIDKSIPTINKGVALGALAYFISPIDMIPDMLVGVGWIDDMAVLTGAAAALGTSIREDHRVRAANAVDGIINRTQEIVRDIKERACAEIKEMQE